jgi:hypothetical protein
MERLKEEIGQARVMRIVPNAASALWLIVALLTEPHEVWSTGKRSGDMTEYIAWMIMQTQDVPQET